jgi:hypothetical protein
MMAQPVIVDGVEVAMFIMVEIDRGTEVGLARHDLSSSAQDCELSLGEAGDVGLVLSGGDEGGLV